MITYPIRSNITVNVAGATNALPIVVTTDSNHELVTGEEVVVVGVQGNTNTDGVHTVTVASATTFSLAGIKGNGNYSFGGQVTSLDALARDYPAVTGLEGTVHDLSGSKLSDLFNLYVDCVDDPTGLNDEVDVKVFGRPDSNAEWFEITQIDHATASWTAGPGGRFANKKVDLAIAPQMRIDVIAEAASTNTVRAWIVA